MSMLKSISLSEETKSILKKVALGSLAALITGVTATVISHKIYKPFKFTPSKLPKRYFLHLQHKEGFMKSIIFNTIKKIQTDLQGFEEAFPNGQYAAIYYDDPHKIEEYAEARAVVGLFYESTDHPEAVEKFLKEHPEYAVKEISEVQTVATEFPFVSKFSSIWLWFVGYGVLEKHVKANNLGNDFVPAVELFSMEKNEVKSIQLHYPHGENTETIWVTTGPQPKPKVVKN